MIALTKRHAKRKKMRTSIAIVTHNRPQSCKECIRSCLAQRTQPLEVIVVDDSEVSFEYDSPKVEVIRCPKQVGVAAARNIAVKNAHGEIIVFIDDDCIADSQWIKVIEETFQGNVDIAGGKVMPILNSPLPVWWKDELYVFISVHRSPQKTQPDIFGCNFAVRKGVFHRIGYFNEKLGRKSGLLLSNEETEFIQRVSASRGKIVFNHRMKVWHNINSKRISMIFLFRRALWQGISNRVQYPVNFKMVSRTIGGAISCLLRTLFTPKQSRYYLLRFIEKLGYFWGLLVYKS